MLLAAPQRIARTTPEVRPDDVQTERSHPHEGWLLSNAGRLSAETAGLREIRTRACPARYADFTRLARVALAVFTFGSLGLTWATAPFSASTTLFIWELTSSGV